MEDRIGAVEAQVSDVESYARRFEKELSPKIKEAVQRACLHAYKSGEIAGMKPRLGLAIRVSDEKINSAAEVNGEELSKSLRAVISRACRCAYESGVITGSLMKLTSSMK